MNALLTPFKITISLALVLSAPISLKAQTIVNGSFESGIPVAPLGAQVDAIDATSITGWTVTSGTVDIVPSTRWQTEDSNRCLDLTGSSAGAIAQTVNGFNVGQQYILFFYMAANPESSFPNPRSMQVSVGTTTQTFSFDVTGHTTSSMGWIQEDLAFTAASSNLTITFQSLVDGLYGPTLDNVSLTPVPEPGLGGMAILVIGLLRFWQGRRV